MSRAAPPSAARAPRIAYVTSSRGVGGAEELIAALVAAGAERGWQQTVLNPFADAASGALAERCAAAGYEARACSTMAQLPAVRAWLAGRLRALAPDIAHVMLFHATVLMASISRHGERRLLTHAYGEGLAPAAASAHAHASGPLGGAPLRPRLGDLRRGLRLSGRLARLPAGVAWAASGWAGAASPVPRVPAAGRPPTVVCVAALRREKGHDTLLAAFAQVRKTTPRRAPRARRRRALSPAGGGDGRAQPG